MENIEQALSSIRLLHNVFILKTFRSEFCLSLQRLLHRLKKELPESRYLLKNLKEILTFSRISSSNHHNMSKNCTIAIT